MHSLKRSFILLVLLAVTLSAVTGGTIAWFTDSVESKANVISAGNLDIELYHTNKTVNNEQVSASTSLFTVPAKWEPGAVAWENLTIANEGSLDLQYQMTINTTNENKVTVDNTDYSLSQVLKVAVVEDGVTQTDRDVLLGAIGTDDWKSFSDFKLTGSLLAGAANKTYGVVIYWAPGDNDNNWNVNNGKKVNDFETTQNNYLHIDLGVKLEATQFASESDSFNNQYDAGAGFENNNGSDAPGELEFPFTWTAEETLTATTKLIYEGMPFARISKDVPNRELLEKTDCLSHAYIDPAGHEPDRISDNVTITDVENGAYLVMYTGYLKSSDSQEPNELIWLCLVVPSDGLYKAFGSESVKAGFYTLVADGPVMDEFTVFIAKFPLEWNTLTVADYPTSFVYEGYPYIKVSPLITVTEDKLAASTCTIEGLDPISCSGVKNVDGCLYAKYLNGTETVMACIVVPEGKEYSSLAACYVGEGIYVINVNASEDIESPKALNYNVEISIPD